MSSVLVDTDVLIDFLRGNAKAKEFLSELSERADVQCSVISVGEIYAGMRELEEPATRELIASLIVIPLTEEIAENAGRMKRRVKGYALELGDCFIAATAIAASAALATNNAKHYPFDGLSLIVPAYH